MSSLSPAERRSADSLGMVAVILAALMLLPALFVFLIGLTPGMNAIWWLGIVLLPIMAFLGLVVLVVGIFGIRRRRRQRLNPVLSVVGVALGVLLLLPGVWIVVASAL